MCIYRRYILYMHIYMEVLIYRRWILYMCNFYISTQIWKRAYTKITHVSVFMKVNFYICACISLCIYIGSHMEYHLYLDKSSFIYAHYHIYMHIHKTSSIFVQILYAHTYGSMHIQNIAFVYVQLLYMHDEHQWLEASQNFLHLQHNTPGLTCLCLACPLPR